MRGLGRAGCEEELEDVGVKVHKEETNGEGGCDGERKFKGRAEKDFKDLGKAWLPVESAPCPLHEALHKPIVFDAALGVECPQNCH